MLDNAVMARPQWVLLTSYYRERRYYYRESCNLSLVLINPLGIK